MIPMLGGISSSPTQIRRISVTSMSKYSAKPAQTPAIFFWATIRRSFLAGAAWAAGPVDWPQLVQKRAVLSRLVPQPVQNMIHFDYNTGSGPRIEPVSQLGRKSGVENGAS